MDHNFTFKSLSEFNGTKLFGSWKLGLKFNELSKEKKEQCVLGFEQYNNSFSFLKKNNLN